MPGWIRYRLACWRSEDGTPAPSLSHGRTERRAAAAAALAATRTEREQAVATRAHLAAASPKACEAMRRQHLQQARHRSTAVFQNAEEVPLTPATEPQDVFEREVLARHTLPDTTWSSEPEADYGSDDAAALAAERAWLAQMMTTDPRGTDDPTHQRHRAPARFVARARRVATTTQLRPVASCAGARRGGRRNGGGGR
ncbi:hypothetical protein ACFV0L_29905 [Streptosporangium canum]|uniref:hypothetical protein n=1 Tax=Streptosporangium canum TaxID=324952 RepID=UPI0036AA5AB5